MAAAAPAAAAASSEAPAATATAEPEAGDEDNREVRVLQSLRGKICKRGPGSRDPPSGGGGRGLRGRRARGGGGPEPRWARWAVRGLGGSRSWSGARRDLWGRPARVRLEGGCVGGGVAWTGRRGLGLPRSGGSGARGSWSGKRAPGQRQREGLGLGARPERGDAPGRGAAGGAGWGREVLPAAPDAGLPAAAGTRELPRGGSGNYREARLEEEEGGEVGLAQGGGGCLFLGLTSPGEVGKCSLIWRKQASWDSSGRRTGCLGGARGWTPVLAPTRCGGDLNRETA